MKARGKLYAAMAAVVLVVGVGSTNVLPAAQAAPATQTANLPEVAAAAQACNPGDTQPMYRLYNRISREHLYTSTTKERDVLTRGDWVYEGVGWVAPKKSSTPVYRLYNPHLGDHHYTTDANEVKALTSKHGWKNEGIGWHSDDCHSIKVYRQYNPQFRVGAHNYTTDLNEYNINNARNGWQGEGVAWYAAEKGWQRGHEPTYVRMAVTVADKDGLANDTFTIPATAGLQYKVGGTKIAAGTYKVKSYFKYTNYSATVTVTATAVKKGYRVKGGTSWTKKIDGRTEVTPKTVSFTDKNGQALDTFTVPKVTGVQYKAGSKNVVGGTYKVRDYFTYTNYMANASVTASPKAGYKFPSKATTSWKKTIDGYTTVTTVKPSSTDAYGKKSDTYTIPDVTGVQYKVNGTNVASGKHTVTTHGANGKATVKITATPKAGYKLTGATSWSFNYTAIVIPQEVMFYDPDGSASDTVTIPETEGVYYTIDGVRKAPGTYSMTSQIGPYSNHHRNASVHAYVKSGYQLSSTSTIYFFHTFTDGVSSIDPVTNWSTKDYGHTQLQKPKSHYRHMQLSLPTKSIPHLVTLNTRLSSKSMVLETLLYRAPMEILKKRLIGASRNVLHRELQSCEPA